jgi:hypothetical protein
MPMLEATDEQLLEVHMRSIRRRVLLVAVPVLAVSTAVGILSAAAPPAAASMATSPCVPYRLPGMAGAGQGNVMWVNDSGVYAGSVADASGGPRPAWWTHSGSDMSVGWTLHVPDIPGTTFAEFLDVNPSGVMSGFAYDRSQGFVYNSNTAELTWLPGFGSGLGSWARRINASGVIAGSAADDTGTSYAATWRPPYAKAERVHAPGESQNVTFPDGTHVQVGSEVDGINDQGTVAGYTFLGGPVHDVDQYATTKQWRNGYAPLLQAFSKSASGVTRLPAGYDQAFGFAINNAGLVVGASLRDANAGFLPAYWVDGVEHDMGAPADAIAGRGLGVSQGGWVAGYVRLPDATRSFVWTGAGSLQFNEPLPGYPSSLSHAANDVLHVVAGFSTDDSNAPVPTVWQCPANFTTG